MESSRRLNPEHLERVKRLADNSAFLNLLGVKLVELDKDYCRTEVTVTPELLNAFGGIHGGAYAAMLDNASYWCLYCGMDEDAGFTTIDLSVSDLRSVNEGLVITEGRAIKYGSTICLSEAVSKDERGRILAHATSKFLVSPKLQPISAAVRMAGADPLPPKFLD